MNFLFPLNQIIQPPLPFTGRRYKCSQAILQNKNNIGDKIYLPPSALHELARLQVTYPMKFEVINPINRLRTHCGVLEFSSKEGECYLPTWVMQYLGLQDGQLVQISNVSLPKGKYVKIRPHKTAFIKLSNPRVVLENALRNFLCLTTGDTISIEHAGVCYQLDVVETKPGEKICIHETDLQVDFDEPKDYVEPKKKTRKSLEKQNRAKYRAKYRISTFRFIISW